MAFIGEVFVADVLGKPVLDPVGDEIGKLRDIVVEGGGTFPKAVGLVLEKRKAEMYLAWEDLSIFNRRIISSRKKETELPAFSQAADTLLIKKDILDKQIVDVNGAKVVRANDVKLTEEGGAALLTDVDVSMRGILRRLGVEKRGDAFFRAIRHPLRHQLISWEFIKPIETKLDRLTLSITRDALSELHPADIAQIISGLAPDDRTDFFEKLDLETAAEALHELEPKVQVDIIDDMSRERASDILERMPPDEAADVLGDLPEAKAQELINMMEKEEAEDVQELLEHEEDTAGGLMTTEFLAYPPDMTVEEAISELRLEAPNVETIYYLFIVDINERIIGVISLKNLILAQPKNLLGEIMKTPVKTLPLDAQEKDVAEFVSKYNLLAVPIVDENEVLRGIVTVDDVVDFLLPPASRKKRRKR